MQLGISIGVGAGQGSGAPAPIALLGDDFEDGVFNGDLWFRTSDAEVVEQNGHMEARNSNFFQTAFTFDLTDKWIAWRQEPDVWARLHFDEDNHLEFRVASSNGFARFLLHSSGGGDSEQGGSVLYSTITNYKFEHSSGDGKIHWLTSSDNGATWDDRASITPPLPISACWIRFFGLAGATFRFVDDVTSNVPVS